MDPHVQSHHLGRGHNNGSCFTDGPSNRFGEAALQILSRPRIDIPVLVLGLRFKALSSECGNHAFGADEHRGGMANQRGSFAVP